MPAATGQRIPGGPDLSLVDGGSSGWPDAARERTARILAVIGTVSLLVGLLFSRLVLDDLGLAGGLALPYWVGLLLLPVAAVVEASRGPSASRRLLATLVIAWFLVVWLTPLVLEGTPRFRTSYSNYGYVDPLVRGDGLDRSRFLYHNWPLFPIATAALRVVGVGAELLLAIFPLIIMAVYLALTVILMKQFDPPNKVAETPTLDRGGLVGDLGTLDPRLLLVLFLFPVFDWTGQDYFSPQALAFAFFLGFAAILANVARAPNRRPSAKQTVALLLVFTAIVATHVLTSLFALGILGALIVTRAVRPWTILATSLVIFVGWQVYIAAPFYGSYGERLLEGLLSLGSFLETNIANRVGGSPGHSLAAALRIVATAIIFAVGAAALYVRLRDRSWDWTMRFTLAYLAGIAVVIPISIYGGEAVIRGLLFSLPMLLGLIYLAIDKRVIQGLVAAALVIGAPLHIFTHYGNELYDYVSPAELAVIHEVVGLAPANIYGGYPAGAYQQTARLDSRNASLPRQDERTTVGDFLEPERHNWANTTVPTYVVLTRGDHAAVRLFRGEPDLIDEAIAALDADPAFEIVFENEDGVIFGRTEDTSESLGGSPAR